MRLNPYKFIFVFIVVVGGLGGGFTLAPLLGVEGAHQPFFVLGYMMLGALGLAIGWAVVSRFIHWLGE